MAVLSSIFCILGLLISVMIAPQLRIWTWGPGMLCFAVAAFASVPPLWREQRNRWDTFLIACGFILFGWIGIRAFLTPAYEASRSDILLLSMAVATFLSIRASISSKSAQRVLIYGLGAILAASVTVIVNQVADPTYSPIFPIEGPKAPAGFFAHYSYGASFLIPSSLILAGFALFSKEHFTAKLLFALVAIAGLVAVYFTKSRGGFVGVGAGVGVLLVSSLLVGVKERKRWFGPAIIIVPIVLIVLSILFVSWLSQVQETRGGDGITGMLDNSIRLYLIGIVFSTIGIHPLLGGGSRSFSWECFQFWDTKAMGWGRAKPEHVHNELLQTASDYGIIGVSILLVFIVAACLIASTRLATDKSLVNKWSADAWRVGGLSAFVGLFAQSNFEGILRIPPGAIMLGICIAALSIPTKPDTDKSIPRIRLSSLLIAALALGLMVPLSLLGWKGTQVSRILWPSFFSINQIGPEGKADAFSQALDIWELPSFYQQRANIRMNMAREETEIGIRDEYLKSALNDFKKAAELHPFDPETALGAANILSVLGRNAEAEIEFRKAVELQGQMEPTFFARSWYARHLCLKGYSELDDEDPTVPLDTFQIAAAQTDWLINLFGAVDHTAERKRIHVKIRQGLGLAYEKIGEHEAAIAEYSRASSLPGGNSSHYLAGMLYGKRAVVAWSERRSSDALRLFIEADASIARSNENPHFITQDLREKYVSYLRESIKFLRGAKVEPSEKTNF